MCVKKSGHRPFGFELYNLKRTTKSQRSVLGGVWRCGAQSVLDGPNSTDTSRPF